MVPLTGRLELSYGDGVLRNYVSGSDRLVVTSGYRDADSSARLPSPLGAGSGDLAIDLRSLVQHGEVSDAGERLLRGRGVRRFVITPRKAAAAPVHWRMVYDADPATFAPIEARVSVDGRGSAPRLTMRLRVDAYRRIPLTATSAKLLTIATTPRTTTTFDTVAQLRERVATWRAACRPMPNGRGLRCPDPPPAAGGP